MDVRAKLEALSAAKRTHRVVTINSDGTVRTYEARNINEANAHLVGEKRKIGKSYINRDTRASYEVVNAYVEAM